MSLKRTKGALWDTKTIQDEHLTRKKNTVKKHENKARKKSLKKCPVKKTIEK
jgi:hypothetical protein